MTDIGRHPHVQLLDRIIAAAEAGDTEQLVWLDKSCIDQTSIDESLACLPVFLAGCRQLLVLAGQTYATRLWCTRARRSRTERQHTPHSPYTPPVHARHPSTRSPFQA